MDKRSLAGWNLWGSKGWTRLSMHKKIKRTEPALTVPSKMRRRHSYTGLLCAVLTSQVATDRWELSWTSTGPQAGFGVPLLKDLLPTFSTAHGLWTLGLGPAGAPRSSLGDEAGTT